MELWLVSWRGIVSLAALRASDRPQPVFPSLPLAWRPFRLRPFVQMRWPSPNTRPAFSLNLALDIPASYRRFRNRHQRPQLPPKMELWCDIFNENLLQLRNRLVKRRGRSAKCLLT